MRLQAHEVAFKQLAENADLWMSSARNLLAASDRLWESVGADLAAAGASPPGAHHADVAQSHGASGAPFLAGASPYLMVAGFAVENALKAIRVKQARAAVTKGKPGKVGLSDVVLTHKLAKLSTAAGIALSTSERELLDRLSAFLRWAGRYPVAATAAGQAAVQVIYGSDQATIRIFFDRIADVFDRLP